MKTQFEEKLKEITTAYMIGLGYTVPPYNGKHSQEYFKQVKTLFTDVVLNAIGDDEDPHWEDITRDSRGIAVKNQWKHEIKAKLYAELGIKER